ncbi:succinate dehydrogenase assembly factor 3, mitochondrial [Nilaparvata lugens]|uniref:succinate dehydrogenase assembly factor 3, mitochondrial n=1 Tax=Nilaparvata lugens TaxID=108931 RepID=UPI00193E3A8A|nr:succinate dehydrogenase assembly factor 3, mitochondrial [Nilaparvata lugens]
MTCFTHLQRVRILYKTILRLHRGLPEGLKFLGDSYARDEFKRHKTCNPAEAAVFMTEWTNYAIQLTEQLGLKGPKFSNTLGACMDEKLLDKMREDQIMQLYELMQASTELKRSETE